MQSRALIFAGLLTSIAGPAIAQTFSNTIFFGDSNSDSGRYLYLPQTKNNPATFATAGAFTTNPGPEWSVGLGQRFGITVTPSDAPGGGNNYAAGGARVEFENPNSNAWSTQSQLAAYLMAAGGRADPKALYSFYIGINDLKTGTTGGAGNIVNPSNPSALTTLGLQTAGQIAALASAGARYILVPNSFSLQTPAAGVASGFGFSTSVAASRALYDQVVWSDLKTRGVNFIPADFNAIQNYVLLNPSPFGITTTNVNTPACGQNVPSINCSPANYVTPNADRTFFFADGPSTANFSGHLTTAVQKIETDYYYSLIAAPSQISFLAEAPIKTRTTFVNTIANQIALSFGAGGPFHGWVTGDVSSLRIDNYRGLPDDPGTPVAISGGFDYRLSRDWLVGVAFSAGTTKQSYSIGGDYRQDEFAASLYTAYRGGPFWGNASLGWGTLHDDVNRVVPLGITTQINKGRTSGTNLSFSAEVGYDFVNALGDVARPSTIPVKAAAASAPSIVVTHGPVAGIVLQQVRIDGFTEFNPSGVPTALAFGGQRRDSAISELGYQASITWGMWQPFVKAVWNHELADTDRPVYASLTSIVAPAYFLPAVNLGRDWGTGTIGTRFTLGPNTTGYVAFIGQVGQGNVATFGGQVGLNVAFNWTAAPVVTKY